MLCILAKKFGNINFLKILKEAVLEISCKPVDAGELVGINGLKPVVKRNFFMKNCFPAVESKKVAEKSENQR